MSAALVRAKTMLRLRWEACLLVPPQHVPHSPGEPLLISCDNGKLEWQEILTLFPRRLVAQSMVNLRNGCRDGVPTTIGKESYKWEDAVDKRAWQKFRGRPRQR